MQAHTKALLVSLLAMPILFASGCATYQTHDEALEKANRALEQSEMANQRVDKLMEMWGNK